MAFASLRYLSISALYQRSASDGSCGGVGVAPVPSKNFRKAGSAIQVLTAAARRSTTASGVALGTTTYPRMTYSKFDKPWTSKTDGT